LAARCRLVRRCAAVSAASLGERRRAGLDKNASVAAGVTPMDDDLRGPPPSPPSPPFPWPPRGAGKEEAKTSAAPRMEALRGSAAGAQ